VVEAAMEAEAAEAETVSNGEQLAMAVNRQQQR
jgi:hypothetical protein